jgi:hypothetical protein
LAVSVVQCEYLAKNKVSFQLIEGKETELQDMINRIIDVDIRYEM